MKQQCNRYTSAHQSTPVTKQPTPVTHHSTPGTHWSTPITRVYTKDQSIPTHQYTPTHQAIPVHTSLHQWHTSQHWHTTLYASLHQWYTSLHQWHQFTLTHQSTPVTSVYTITHQWDTSPHQLHTSLYQWHNTSHQWNTDILIKNHTIRTHEERDSLNLALSGCEQNSAYLSHFTLKDDILLPIARETTQLTVVVSTLWRKKIFLCWELPRLLRHPRSSLVTILSYTGLCRAFVFCSIKSLDFIIRESHG